MYKRQVLGLAVSNALVALSGALLSQYQVDEVQKYLEAKGVTATQYAFSDSNDRCV